MKCAICCNKTNNETIFLKEMMFGFRDQFTYFKCSNCGCIQIAEVPNNLHKYYPQTYYSFKKIQFPIKRSFFRKLQYKYIAGANKNLFGKIAVYKYKPPSYYEWLKNLNLINFNSKILDVGCGNGELLAKMYRLGFNDLTGIDPFIASDFFYNKTLRVLKKTVFEIEGNYDVIMLHHSLEHMQNQIEILKKLCSLLNNNGKILIRIPIVSKALMHKYKLNVVSLDAPRHLYIHTLNSINLALTEADLTVKKTVFDSDVFALLASEQYVRDVSILNDDRSYFVNQSNSIFSSTQIEEFKREIKELNKTCQSDNVALYITKT
ncbi:MAG: class I SAM-dependent methyltransferase [Chitinophagaceae bacterium]